MDVGVDQKSDLEIDLKPHKRAQKGGRWSGSKIAPRNRPWTTQRGAKRWKLGWIKNRTSKYTLNHTKEPKEVDAGVDQKSYLEIHLEPHKGAQKGGRRGGSKIGPQNTP